MGEYSKVNESEMILWGFFLFAVDGLCALLDFIGVGLVLSPIIQGGCTFFVSKWLQHAKGSQSTMGVGRLIGKFAANVLPGIPTLTCAFFYEVFVHNHPKIGGVAEVATSIASKKVPGIPGVAGGKIPK